MLNPEERVRLHKIVRMLESTHEGERSNAATILLRAAKDRKLTMPELMVLIVGAGPQPSRTPPPPPPPPPRQSPPPPPPRQSWSHRNPTPFVDMLIEILNSGRTFANEWETDFLESMRQRLSQWGPDIIISPKQAQIIERIHRKL